MLEDDDHKSGAGRTGDDGAPRFSERMHDLGDSAKDKAEDLLEKAEDALDSVGDALGDLADDVADKAQHLADAATERLRGLRGSRSDDDDPA